MAYPSQFPSSFPAPTHQARLPAAKSPIRRLLTRGAIVTGLFLVASVGFLVYAKLWPQHTFLIANDNDFAVEVSACGKSVTVAPHAVEKVKVKDGTCEVSATGAGGFAEKASVVFPDNNYTLGARTAVYNVGGKSQLAVVTIEYGTAGGRTPPVVAVAQGDTRVELLSRNYGPIDDPFPTEVKSSRMGEMVAHLCHVDFEKQTVGCPGL